jgi:hypothetical protein
VASESNDDAPADARDADMVAALGAAFKIVARPGSYDALADPVSGQKTLQAEFGLPASDDVRQQLLRIRDLARRDDRARRSLVADVEAEDQREEDAMTARADETRRVLMKTYGQIRVSFTISLVMSAVLFLVGLALLTLAVARAVGEEEVQTSTLTIAGLGVADFVVLFYARPWRDIAANVVNTQRAHMVATSYLSELALAGRERPDTLRLVHEITRDYVLLLEGRSASEGPSEPDPGQAVG